MRRLHGVSTLISCAQTTDAQLAKYTCRCLGLVAASELCLEELIKYDTHSILADIVKSGTEPNPNPNPNHLTLALTLNIT